MQITVINNIFIRYSETKESICDVWFIHGYGESGLSFNEAFDSKLPNYCNIYVPDLPGFGVSAFNPQAISLPQVTEHLKKLIRKVSKSRPIILVAHSMGSIVGTLLCQEMPKQIKVFLSIEGFLVEDTSRYSSQIDKHKTANAFRDYMVAAILADANKDHAKLRYAASVMYANSIALQSLAKSCKIMASGETMGIQFKALPCKKIYFWGSKSLSEKQKEFIIKNNIENQSFDSCGHWLMIDNPKKFYDHILNTVFTTKQKY